MTRSHVTQREANAVVGYASALMDAMRMPQWTILVMEAPADDAEASIDWIDQRHVAQLYLCDDWMKFDSDRRRNVVTHEVLHLLHSRVSTVALDDAEPYMRDHEHSDWSRRVRREFELMVDHLAFWMSHTHSLEEAWEAAHQR